MGSMNDDVITDLKQFIAATVSQQSVQLRDELEDVFNARFIALENSFNAKFAALDYKLDSMAAAIGDAIDDLSQHIDDRFAGHEKRIVRVERKVLKPA